MEPQRKGVVLVAEPEHKAQTGTGKRRGALPSYWASVWARVVTLLYASLVLGFLLDTGKMVVPLRHFPDVTFSENPLLFLLAAAFNAWIVATAWFYAPYQSWNFTLRLPPNPEPPRADDSYAGYIRPPRKIGPLRLEPLHLSDVLDSALANSLLWVVWMFGVMITLAGIVQLYHGTFYIGHDGAIEIVDYADDTKQFLRVLLVYATIGVGTGLLGVLLYFWDKLRVPKLKLDLNLGKPPGGNVR